MTGPQSGAPPGNESRPGQGGHRDITDATSVTDAVAFDRLLDALADRVVRSNQVQASARCPAHDDTNPSLSIRASEGRVLVYCHAGCETVDVLAALDLTMADLFDSPNGVTYRYDDGRVVRRTPDKRFWQ